MAIGARQRHVLFYLGICAGALALRVAGAQGDLWLDEIWSLAHVDGGSPIDVFTSIHHDNNHHLNSLWLVLVGSHQPPMLYRVPAVAAGTATVLLLASMRPGGRVAAVLAASSSFLVHYDSEARGYALAALFCVAGRAPSRSARMVHHAFRGFRAGDHRRAVESRVRARTAVRARRHVGISVDRISQALAGGAIPEPPPVAGGRDAAPEPDPRLQPSCRVPGGGRRRTVSHRRNPSSGSAG